MRVATLRINFSLGRGDEGGRDKEEVEEEGVYKFRHNYSLFASRMCFLLFTYTQVFCVIVEIRLIRLPVISCSVLLFVKHY